MRLLPPCVSTLPHLHDGTRMSPLGHFEKKLPVGQVVGYTAETCLDEAGGRTQNGLLAKSSPKHLFLQVKYRGLAGVTGLEPAASGVTGRRSNRLSYTPTQGWRTQSASPSLLHTAGRGASQALVLLIGASCPQSWRQNSRLRIIPVSAERAPLSYSSWDLPRPARNGRTEIPAAGDAAA